MKSQKETQIVLIDLGILFQGTKIAVLQLRSPHIGWCPIHTNACQGQPINRQPCMNLFSDLYSGQHISLLFFFSSKLAKINGQ